MMFQTKLFRYCKTNSPTVEVKGTKLGVVFKSNKRSKGGAGASCTATCTAAGAVTPAPTPGLAQDIVILHGIFLSSLSSVFFRVGTVGSRP